MTPVDRTPAASSRTEWAGGPKILGMLAGAMLVAGMVLTLYFYYAPDLPSHAIASTGQVVRIESHGDVRYITELDWWLSHGMARCGVFIGFLAKIWQLERRGH